MSKPQKDTVKPQSGFLCTYMSNHPDTLVAYVRHQGRVSEEVQSAKMTSIDQQAMSLTYKLVHSPSTEKSILIPFDPPLTGYSEVKPRLLSLKLDAEESLGMTPRPQLKSFRIPRGMFTQTGPLMLFLLYTTYGESEPVRWLRATVGGDRTIVGIWWFVAIVHGLESLYALSLCRRHRTGWVNGILFVFATLLVGAPIWVDMRRRIQRMRIESINKVH